MRKITLRCEEAENIVRISKEKYDENYGKQK